MLFYFIFKARERNIKLWDKGTSVNELIESFTIGKDRELDLHLAKYDVLCSMSHAKILQSINLLSASELTELQNELIAIYQVIENGNFQIEEGAEDVHSQVELMLTRKLGDVGKKNHSGRSRNGQILLDLKLFTRSEIQKLVVAIGELFGKMIAKKMETVVKGYEFQKIEEATASLLGLS